MSQTALPDPVRPQARRRSRQRLEAQRAILDAAEELLIEGGYDQFSMRRLAERCGYTAATLYHYFTDKPELIDALIEERFSKLVVFLRGVPDEPDAADTVRALASAFAHFGLENPTFYRLLMTPRKGVHPVPAAEEALTLLHAPLHVLAAEGRLRCGDATVAGQCLWSAVHGALSLRTSRPDYPWVEDMLDRTLEGMLFGMVGERDGPEGRR